MSAFAKDSDVMYIRLETLYNVEATLIRGAYLEDSRALIYTKLGVGWTFTAWKGIKFFISFRSTAATQA